MIRRKPNLSPEMNEALDALDEARTAIGVCTMNDRPPETDHFAYRVAVAYLILKHIRERLINGEGYSSYSSPNIQSAIDALIIPIDYIKRSVGKSSEFQPSVEMMKQIEHNWKQTFTDEQLLAGEHLP